MVAGGACVVGVCVWLPGVCMVAGGTCMVAGEYAWLLGGMCGCGGHAWLREHARLWGACMVAGGHAWFQGGMCGCGGGHAWLLGGMSRIGRDTVIERAVRILLECILVTQLFCHKIGKLILSLYE